MDLIAQSGVLARAGAGLVLLALLPGWAWSRALLPDVDRLERCLYSIGLSVALMALALYAGDLLLEVRIDAVRAIWWALALTAGGLALRPRSSRTAQGANARPPA